MSQSVRMLSAAAMAFVVAASVAACTQASGPSLTVAIEGQSLQPDPTSKPALCCCLVVGNVQNTSSIPVNVEARFWATGPGGATLQAMAWVTDIAPGATAPFSAPGFTVPCSEVSNVRDDPLAFGIYSLPPQ